MRARGLSLWLIPDEADARALRARIASLAGRLGTPRFEPHVTLLGGLEPPEPQVLARVQRLSELSAPFSVRVAGIGGLDDYFRCLFLELAHHDSLQALLEAACQAYGQSGSLFPHLSLVYGDLDAGPKARLLRELEGSAPAAIRLDGLRVVHTEGEVSEWLTLQEFPLLGRG